MPVPFVLNACIGASALLWASKGLERALTLPRTRGVVVAPPKSLAGCHCRDTKRRSVSASCTVARQASSAADDPPTIFEEGPDSESALWTAVQRAQWKAGASRPGGSLEALVSVGEVARQGLPLAGLEKRLFALAAKRPARIVTTRDGELFFAFREEEIRPKRRVVALRNWSKAAKLVAPYALFGAAESFFLFFPIPFFLLRIGAIAFASAPWVIPGFMWIVLWPALLPAYAFKSIVTSSSPGSASRRENFVVRWAREEGLLRSRKDAGPSGRKGADLPWWRQLVEDMWPWQRDPNREIKGPWRWRILTRLAVAKDCRLTAAEMAPFLDPDPARHQTVDDFLNDADGLAQPYVAGLGGVPDWGQTPIVYNFPAQLRLQASRPSSAGTQGAQTDERRPTSWRTRASGFLAGAVRVFQRAAGHGRERLPSYLEELPWRPRANVALRAQMLFCVVASLWIPVGGYLGLLRRYVGFVPTSLARYFWPMLLAIALGLYVDQSRRVKEAAQSTTLAAFRNKIRYEAAWRSAKRLGAPGTKDVDLDKERWYDTAEPIDNFEMRRFDDKL